MSINISIIVPVHNSGKTLDQVLLAVSRYQTETTELIIVDDHSQDESLLIAHRYSKNVIASEKNIGRNKARLAGFQKASGGILVNIDSDVVVAENTIETIGTFFKNNLTVSAVTGLLSKEHPHGNFASQYKNLYMHYVFSGVPKEVTFLYGSVFALRREVVVDLPMSSKIADDTEWGQALVSAGHKICLLSELEVVHLKKYSLLSLIQNDFKIPHDWAQIFWKRKGWRQLGKKDTGFAHASKRQLVSVLLAPSIIFSITVSGILGSFDMGVVTLSSYLFWLALNWKFLLFLFRERGLMFFLQSLIWIFFDHLIMFIGIVFGTISYFLTLKKR